MFSQQYVYDRDSFQRIHSLFESAKISTVSTEKIINNLISIIHCVVLINIFRRHSFEIIE